MIKNWLIRGDTHGQFSWMTNGCLDEYNPAETAIIILGDAGFNFYLDKFDEKLKREVNERGFRFYCVRGKHEARPQNLSIPLSYDSTVFGNVYMEPKYPNIRYFKDWGQYWINGYHTAVIGGAYSVDKWYRLQRMGILSTDNYDYNNPRKTGWFEDEQLNTEEMSNAEKELEGKYFHFVFTHTCPISWQPSDLFLKTINQSNVDNSMELWLDNVKDKINWKIWCFGHYHADRLERPYIEQYYNDIESINNINARWARYEATGELDWWLNKSPNFYAT